jgi:hypothetical protein
VRFRSGSPAIWLSVCKASDRREFRFMFSVPLTFKIK